MRESLSFGNKRLIRGLTNKSDKDNVFVAIFFSYAVRAGWP